MLARDGQDAAAGVDQPSTGKSCTHASAGTGASTRLDMRCDGLAAGEKWRINLGPGLASPSGVPVKTFAGATTVHELVDRAALPASGDGCRVWRP